MVVASEEEALVVELGVMQVENWVVETEEEGLAAEEEEGVLAVDLEVA